MGEFIFYALMILWLVILPIFVIPSSALGIYFVVSAIAGGIMIFLGFILQ